MGDTYTRLRRSNSEPDDARLSFAKAEERNLSQHNRNHHHNHGHHDEVDHERKGLQLDDNVPPQHRFFKTTKALHSAISFAAGTAMLLFGYEQGVFGGIIVAAEFQEYFNHPSPAVEGFVVSVYDLGCFFGAILTLAVGEKLGRRRMLMLFTVIMGIGIIVQTVSVNMNQMIWGRLIAGIGNGGNTATAPVWHVETSHASAKGTAVVKEMAVNVLGFVISNFVTLAFSGMMTETQWRFPLGIQLVFVVIILTMVPMLPESPRWLLARKRDAEAKHVLAILSEHDVAHEFEEIRASVKAEQAVRASWAQIFRGGLATRRMLLGMMLQTAQQLSGINVLAYYLPVVLHRSVGLSEPTARLVAAANAISFFLTTTASIAWIERIGRRPLLMFGAGVMSVAFLGVSIGVGTGLVNPDSHTPGIIATAFIWLYFTIFSSGWISVPWLYPAEVSSLSMRTKGAALATACDWLFNYVVVQTTPPGIEHLKWGLYLVYAVLNALFVPLVYYFVVETKGRSLEDTDRWFENNRRWLVHKADHSAGSNGVKMSDFVPLGASSDDEAMMGAFEMGSDEDDESIDLNSPTTPRFRSGLS
ncbi:and other transporter-domain-containing protein [Pseudomassariella vexata]|uniref:And other transporter-domain-containing protein n=1 Tax=Pseudomassariella vexata TaxID=1141098 RepID=A0A1Y2EBI4_9PEZI|nr:and other transporter-domain-containing protein [Pseudomassariella vexata]ORY68943.1 and other transporter-domain-containing protein [Pseudomassariella vexata]